MTCVRRGHRAAGRHDFARHLRDIAQNVGELEGDTGFLGEPFRPQIAVTEDADADQSDDGGDQVTVTIKFGEGRDRCRARRLGRPLSDPWQRQQPIRREARAEY